MKVTMQDFLICEIEQWDKNFDAVCNVNDLSLSCGLAGFLMLEATLYRTTGLALHARRSLLLRDRIIDLLQSTFQCAGLWTGLAGALYAFEYTRQFAPELISLEIVEFIGDTDAHLVSLANKNSERLPYDLIGGLCGVGAYSLMRSDGGAARRIYGAIEAALVSRAVPMEGGLTWLTTPRFASTGIDLSTSPEGYIDFGIAHGTPGVAAMMAGALARGVATVRTEALLADALRCLRAQARTDLNECIYPTDSLSISTRSRLAWCYGDLGPAIAFLLAGEATGNHNDAAFGLQLAEQRMAGSKAGFLFNDSATCHGRVGVWRIARKMCARSANPTLTAATGDFLREVIEGGSLSGQVYSGQSDFLDGKAGVLVSLLMDGQQDERPWDTCFDFGLS